MGRYENVLKNIDRELAERGIKRKYIARALGISESTLSRYIGKTRKVSLDMMVQIADVLCVSVDDLVRTEGEERELTYSRVFLRRLEELELQEQIELVNYILNFKVYTREKNEVESKVATKSSRDSIIRENIKELFHGDLWKDEQEYALQRLEMSLERLNKYIEGSLPINLDMIVKFADGFRVSVDHILRDGDESVEGFKVDLIDAVRENMSDNRISLIEYVLNAGRGPTIKKEYDSLSKKYDWIAAERNQLKEENKRLRALLDERNNN